MTLFAEQHRDACDAIDVTRVPLLVKKQKNSHMVGLHPNCIGRPARERLKRAVMLADKAVLAVSATRKIHARLR